MAESHKASLDELIQAIAENMTAGEIARTIIAINAQDFIRKVKALVRRKNHD